MVSTSTTSSLRKSLLLCTVIRLSRICTNGQFFVNALQLPICFRRGLPILVLGRPPFGRTIAVRRSASSETILVPAGLDVKSRDVNDDIEWAVEGETRTMRASDGSVSASKEDLPSKPKWRSLPSEVRSQLIKEGQKRAIASKKKREPKSEKKRREHAAVNWFHE